MKLHADLSLRAAVDADALDWVASPAAGVERRMLERDGDEVARATSLVRYAPGSAFSAHLHGAGEEFLVLEGVFSDETGDYPAGWYVRNPPGSRHAPRSAPGAVIFVKLRQMRADDTRTVRIDTRDPAAPWRPHPGVVQGVVPGSGSGLAPGVVPGMAPGVAPGMAPGVASGAAAGSAVLPLHDAPGERVELLRWAPGTRLPAQRFPGGAEYFVLEGAFTDGDGAYGRHAWLRLPPDSVQAVRSDAGALVYRKTGHLVAAGEAG